MTFPDNPSSFIDYNNPHLANGWQNVFGEYAWFRLPGFIEAVVDLQRHALPAGKRVSYDTIKQCRMAAIGQVPKDLEDLLPSGEWDIIAGPQVDLCKAGHPMRFDKACLAAATLDQCARQIAPETNPLTRVKIAPAIFLLAGFDSDKWKEIKARGPVAGVPFVDALKRHTNQVHTNFFTELAKGYSATYHTLALMVEFLNQHNLSGGLLIEQKTSRDYGDGAKPKEQRLKKRPNQLETVVAR